MIIRLTGGLGNQMFEYAFGRAMTTRYGEDLHLDTWAFWNDKLRDYELDKYNIQANGRRYLKRALCNIMWNVKIHFFSIPVLEKCLGMEYEKEVFGLQEISKNADYLVGCWQNCEYFSEIKNDLRQELKYTGELTLMQLEKIQQMQSEESVAMHIRRGDYLTETCQKIYCNLTKDYYERAIQYLKEQGINPKIYIFSDDINWCKEEYKDWQDVEFIDETLSQNQHTDLELMRNCKHFVIANSTFSWWASWLSENEKKIVIAPSQWFYNKAQNKKVQDALLKETILL